MRVALICANLNCTLAQTNLLSSEQAEALLAHVGRGRQFIAFELSLHCAIVCSVCKYVLE